MSFYYNTYICLVPPSFSFATTLGSQAAMEVSELKATELQRINIQLPQFPGYNTFNSHTQSPCYTNDSLLEGEQYYNSCGSLFTDHTGRSLDTLDVLSYGERLDNDSATSYIDEGVGEEEEPRGVGLNSSNPIVERSQ